MKDKGKRTRYPGVYRIDARTHRITARFQDERTGKTRWLQRLLQDVSAQEAAAERKRLLAAIQGDLAGTAEQVRIGDYARSWLESKALHVDVATVERYAQALRDALDHFGHIYAHALRPPDIQAWIDSAIRAGYSPETIRSWFSAVRTMIRDAVNALDLARDPTQRIHLPASPERAEVNAFTPEELARFLAVMRDQHPQHYALAATLAFTGLRFCHISALRWEDVDLQAGILTIQRKQVRGIVGPVSRKKRAPRTYPITPELVAILKWHRHEYPGLPAAWVFPSRVGKLRKAPSSLRKAWLASLEVAGIHRRVTVHGLRRTFTDLARLAGVDGVVSRSLIGHTERMREHYSHIGQAEQRQAVARTLAVVTKSVVPTTF